MNPTALAATIGLIAPVLLLPPISALARRLGAVATPRADRWHRGAIPMLGGVAIAGGIVAGLFVLPINFIDRAAMLAGICAMALLGFADDLGTVSPGRRLVLETITAAAFTAAVTGGLALPIRIAAVAAASAAVPVAINATNLVDNADGLASLLSAVSGLVLAGIAQVSGLASAGGPIALVIAAACIAFLLFNRPPARVFMGDSGSLMLGFALAGCSILIVRDALMVPGDAHLAAAMAIPLAWSFQVGDLVMVFVTRLRRHASPFQGDVDHTSHRLMSAGLGPVAMLAALSLGAALVGAVAIAAAAFAGHFVVVAALTIVASLVVGVFEAVVAWRLPYRRPEPAEVPSPSGVLAGAMDPS